MNLVIGLPSELEGTTSPVQDALMAHLRAQGREVERLKFGEATRYWRAAQAEPGSEGFEATAGKMVAAMARDHEFDAVVIPSVVSQTMRVNHLPTRWDGVKRRLRQGRVQRGSLITTLEISMDLPVLSLLVFGFTPDGRQVFQGRGGLDIPYEILFTEDGMRWNLHFRNDLFQDRSQLEESLGVAFHPDLTRPPGR